MRTFSKIVVMLLVGSVFLTSCVSSKKYKTLQADKDAMSAKYEQQLSDLKSSFKNKEADLNSQVSSLTSDLSSANSDVIKYKGLSDEKAAALAKINAEIKSAFSSISNADLKIIQKFDKLYISLPNRILYKKGDAKISKDGKVALEMLAGIFKSNPKMDVLVEGHTDSDPVRRTRYKFKDNWGLSSARAVNAVRFLAKNGVNAKQMSAAGRAEQYTTGELMEGKDELAYDRRIEFVVTPDVHKLYSINKNL